MGTLMGWQVRGLIGKALPVVGSGPRQGGNVMGQDENGLAELWRKSVPQDAAICRRDAGGPRRPTLASRLAIYLWIDNCAIFLILAVHPNNKPRYEPSGFHQDNDRRRLWFPIYSSPGFRRWREHAAESQDPFGGDWLWWAGGWRFEQYGR